MLKYVVIGAVAFMCILGFASMYIDKQRAIKGKWRISEKALFLIAILLGGLGSYLGMILFRHKTNHWYFVVFFPIFAILSIGVVVLAVLYLV